jgi:hypothetical protein
MEEPMNRPMTLAILAIGAALLLPALALAQGG